MHKLPQQWQYVIFNKLHVGGITLFPFIIAKSKLYLSDKKFVNHEHIHLRQQLELLLLLFYMLYLINYGINLVKYRNHQKAYLNICFEREAYKHESNAAYLRERKFFAWINYL